MASRRRTWFLIRVGIYLAVIAALFLWRGGVNWPRFKRLLQPAQTSAATLSVAGRDLAPDLVDRLVSAYRRDYPDLTLTVSGGGTNRALEELLSDRTDVAFLIRPPTAAEQGFFRETTGDTAVYVPVAIGGIAVVAGAEADTSSLTVAALRELLIGNTPGRCETFYLPDPNGGLWDALRLRLAEIAGADAEANTSAEGGDGSLADADGPLADGGLPDFTNLPAGSPVVFLTNEKAVVAAVSASPHCCGLVSTLAIRQDDNGLPAVLMATLPLCVREGGARARPTYADLASGAYPLYHRLYAACRGSGNIRAGMFVTHLTSARGLRQVERAGAVPAKQILREIYLTREPVGG